MNIAAGHRTPETVAIEVEVPEPDQAGNPQWNQGMPREGEVSQIVSYVLQQAIEESKSFWYRLQEKLIAAKEAVKRAFEVAWQVAKTVAWLAWEIINPVDDVVAAIRHFREGNYLGALYRGAWVVASLFPALRGAKVGIKGVKVAAALGPKLLRGAAGLGAKLMAKAGPQLGKVLKVAAAAAVRKTAKAFSSGAQLLKRAASKVPELIKKVDPLRWLKGLRDFVRRLFLGRPKACFVPGTPVTLTAGGSRWRWTLPWAPLHNAAAAAEPLPPAAAVTVLLLGAGLAAAGPPPQRPRRRRLSPTEVDLLLSRRDTHLEPPLADEGLEALHQELAARQELDAAVVDTLLAQTPTLPQVPETTGSATERTTVHPAATSEQHKPSMAGRHRRRLPVKLSGSAEPGPWRWFATLRLALGLVCMVSGLGLLADWAVQRWAHGPTGSTLVSEASFAAATGDVRRLSWPTPSAYANDPLTGRRVPVYGVPIEEVQLGQRVLAFNPERDPAERRADREPSPHFWRRAKLRLQKENGSWVEIELLRPLTWFEAHHVTVPVYTTAERSVTLKARVWLELEEFGAVGWAELYEIGPCPPIEPGPGAVVTGRFRHRVDEVITLTVANGRGETEELGVTPNHPIWSEDRQAFVPAGELQVGEQLRSLFDEQIHVVSIAPRAPPVFVYNLEVAAEHVYGVTAHALLAHNACPRRPKLTDELQRYKGGKRMTAMDHIWDHHGPQSKVGGKGQFDDWVTKDEARKMIEEALEKGEVVYVRGRPRIIYDFGRIIGRDVRRDPTSKLTVYLDEKGEDLIVRTAFPGVPPK